MTKPFDRVALIGIGLIGSSLAHAMRKHKLAGEITGYARSEATRAKAMEISLVDIVFPTAAETVKDADLVILCSPVGTYGELAREIGPRLSPGAILTDVGSVKGAVVRDVLPHVPRDVNFIPGHPIAGTEQSGPESGFAELFINRWCILTPVPGGDAAAVAKVTEFWRKAGSKIETMQADHHDKVLAITSHLPHLIAFTIVGTADDLAEDLKQEVIQYSATGFRDFTRIAASDPVMWRDIFMNNRDATLEVLQRFTEDLTALQRAIRRGDGESLEKLFARTRAIRRSVIDAKQA